MKLIIAIIKPNRLEAVQDALSEVGQTGVTVSEVSGYGRQGGHTEIYRGAEYDVSFVPKLKLEVAVPDDRLDAVTKAIVTAAQTGKVGDGKVFHLSLDNAVRIRTGESGEDAL